MMTALRLSGLCLVPLYSLVDGIEPLRHAERRSIEVPATATRRASSVSLGLEGGAEELGALSASHMDGFKVVPHHRLVLENDILGGERIVGGSPADLHEYGFFVQGSGCGASLVAPDVVLTAAHCEGAFQTGGTVYVSPLDKTTPSEGEEALKVVSPLYLHPNFVDGESMKWDFMVFKIEASTKAPIPLNFYRSHLTDGEPLTTIGFGTTSSGGPTSPVLLEAAVNFVSMSHCNSFDMYDGAVDATTMLCAAAPGRDSCQGDSGGPLFDANGIQVGVTSWGYGCADASYPGIYSNVYAGREWIAGKICELSDSPPSYCAAGPSETQPVAAPTSVGGEACGESPQNVTPPTVPRTKRPSAAPVMVAPPTLPPEAHPVPAPVAAPVSAPVAAPVATPVAPPVAAPAPTAPTANCSPEPLYIFDMKYDKWPGETRWYLRDLATDEMVYSYGYTAVTEAGFELRGSLPRITEGSEYQLVFHDSFGDGFCCDEAFEGIPGYARLTKVKNCVVEELVYSDGQFNEKAVYRFMA